MRRSHRLTWFKFQERVSWLINRRNSRISSEFRKRTLQQAPLLKMKTVWHATLLVTWIKYARTRFHKTMRQMMSQMQICSTVFLILLTGCQSTKFLKGRLTLQKMDSPNRKIRQKFLSMCLRRILKQVNLSSIGQVPSQISEEIWICASQALQRRYSHPRNSHREKSRVEISKASARLQESQLQTWSRMFPCQIELLLGQNLFMKSNCPSQLEASM